MEWPLRGVRRALLAVALFAACTKREDKPAEASGPPPAPAAVPVRAGVAARATLEETVRAPGKTAALVQQKVRAPFAGTLTEFTVVDGDPVRKGQRLGAIVSRESEAALSGAREMASEARTPAEKRDAERAVALAEQALVKRALLAPADGAVLTHGAAPGDRVAEDQDLLTIAEASAIVFLADAPQSDVERIKPGQQALVELAGQTRPATGTVHAILPGANPADFTAPVRIDLAAGAAGIRVGLFGTAQIAVGTHRDAVVVPPQAILRDDVTGVSRLATIREDGKAHWIEVQTGLSEPDRLEIVSPALAPGTRVIVSGQVGLPEGSPVSIQP